MKIKRCKASFLKTILIGVALLVGLPQQNMAQRLDVFLPSLGILDDWGLIFDQHFPSNRTGWSWAVPFYYTGPYTTTQVSITSYFLSGALRKYSHDFTQNFSLDLSLGAGLVLNHQWKLNCPQIKETHPITFILPLY